MLKTHIDKAKVFVTARFKNEGSVLRETVHASYFDSGAQQKKKNFTKS